MATMTSIPISVQGYKKLEDELARLKSERPAIIQAIKEAREEGFDKIAFLFEKVAEIEKHHEERYLALLANVEKQEVFKKSDKKTWICRNCGFIVEAVEAPKVCPVCAHPQSFFELRNVNY